MPASLLDKIEILYEDNDIVAINKSAGIILHSDGKREEESVADWMINKYPDAKDVGEQIVLPDGNVILRPGIVHRIDRETSGVVVLAKNQEAFEFLKEQFKGREIEKIYHAFVYGSLKDEEGEINRPIGRSKKDFRKWSAQRGARGELREAITQFKVLSRLENATFLEIKPLTGRTHQIRVHMKAINHPVVGDKLYAPKGEKLFNMDRLALHARKIKFKNMAQEYVEIEAPYPPDFSEAINFFDGLPL